jgi:hypothetical protein
VMASQFDFFEAAAKGHVQHADTCFQLPMLLVLALDGFSWMS